MRRKHFVVSLLAALFICFSNSSWAYVITGSGGDCQVFGTWNGKTKTCTFTKDIYITGSNSTAAGFQLFGYSDAIFIEVENGVTLDGNGHTINASAFQRASASIIGVQVGVRTSNSKLKNLTISGFDGAILLYGTGEGNTITGNTITGNGSGIHIRNGSKNNVVSGNRILNNGTAVSLAFGDTTGNIITQNTISGNGSGGRLGYSGQGYGNTYSNNVVSNNSIGVEIDSANNVVSGNTFSGSSIEDLRLKNLTGNIIYNNNFTSVKNLGWVLDDIYAYSTNQFSKDLPVGGNYWSNFDSSEEGCTDVNLDGVCDQQLNPIAAVIDNFPWTSQNGWPVNSGGSTGGGTKGGGRR